jgi:hypothetical protein
MPRKKKAPAPDSSNNGNPSAGVTWDEFIRVWQSAGSDREVAEKIGRSLSGVRQRAAKARKNGVPLKRFGHSREKVEWGPLVQLAESLT